MDREQRITVIEYFYRFSVGNSNTDAVGLCFDVILEQEDDKPNHEAAVAKAKELLADTVEPWRLRADFPLYDMCVYINADHITADDIVLEGALEKS